MYINLVFKQIIKLNFSPLKACRYLVIADSYEPVEYMFCENSKIAYIVNSKVACSSFKQIILEKNLKNLTFSNYAEIHKKSALHKYSRKELNNPDDYYTFTFVRNPFKRLVSLYINKFSDQNIISEIGFEYENYLGGVFQKDMAFIDFVKVIVNIPDKLADRHFKSQSYLIKQAVKVDYIGNMENITDDYKELRNRFCLPELTHANKSTKYNYLDFLNSESIELLYKRYKKDFELFNYMDEYNDLKKSY